jgi:small subunit ribosomal protein S17
MTDDAQIRNRRKVREGVVTSDKMDKTVVVRVQDLVRHPLYRRVIKRTAKFKAHDETNDCRAGDRVRIMEARPLSKEKCWRVIEVVERAK